MKSFKDIILTTIEEELKDHQKRTVDSWITGNKFLPSMAEHISNHVPGFNEHGRHIIPLEDPNDKVDIPHHPEVKNLLKNHGYEIKNYLNGLAVDKHGRDVKIGKVLNKVGATPGLIKTFNNDPNRDAARIHKNLQVVISRHPYDVAGMSTNRGWTSCMDMEKSDTGKPGEYSNHLENDIEHGTHVAYLTKKGDDTIQNPVARIALKPFTSEGEADDKHYSNLKDLIQNRNSKTHTILRPETSVYGTAASSFEHTVNKWTNEHFPMNDKHGTYEKPDNLYNDSYGTAINPEHFIKHPENISKSYNKSGIFHAISQSPKSHELFHSLIKDHYDDHKGILNNEMLTNIAQHGNDSHRDKLVNHPDRFVRAAVNMFGNDQHRLNASKNERDIQSLYDLSYADHNNPKIKTQVHENIFKRLNHADAFSNPEINPSESAPFYHKNIAAQLLIHSNEKWEPKFKNMKTSHEEFEEKMAGSKNPFFKEETAKLTKNPKILDTLINDPDKNVRYNAILNSQTNSKHHIDALKGKHHISNTFSDHVNLYRDMAQYTRNEDLTKHIHEMEPAALEQVATFSNHTPTLKAMSKLPYEDSSNTALTPKKRMFMKLQNRGYYEGEGPD